MSTYNEVLEQAQTLTPDEQERLLEDLAMLVRQRVVTQAQKISQKSPGLDLDRWRGFLPKRVDALEFQLKLRQEWDEQ
ncbi:hypothetical protein [Argonema galeatum]|uniref:hypothetical protein n=1 Tax=Argonema galeatum TaxID=2942762 RepID=UPI002011B41A|nr:hypothetical protein [Argonema galeatum]MCL1465671.1 hypothetical protein [Argonema galeatum A003/A1]